MLGAADIGELLKIGLGLAVVVVAVVFKIFSERAKATPGAKPRRVLSAHTPTPMRQAQPPQSAPTTPQPEGDSALAMEVAQQLAPDFVKIAHSTSLLRPETIEDADSSTLINLREPGAARRAILLNEILRKPLGLRRPRR